MYEIVKVIRWYEGRCRVTREKSLTRKATKADVEKIINKTPERYEGERAEFWDDMEQMGCADYNGYMIFERN